MSDVLFGPVLSILFSHVFYCFILFFFFFQAEDGIRDHCVTGVQTCALPICAGSREQILGAGKRLVHSDVRKPCARARQDDSAQQRQPRHDRPRRHALGHARLGRDDEEKPLRQPDTPVSATPRPPARLEVRAECSSAAQSDASSRLAPRGAWPVTSARNWSATASNQSGD